MEVPTDDLAFAFALADAADSISTAHFRSEAIRTTTKYDGTPVSQVDLAVETAMLALVHADRPGDSVLGEEVGAHPGSSRRWIFDGIDGTHNYSDGRPGWGTIIALEIDGAMAIGLVSAPLFGWRWWAVAGGGAWRASHSFGETFDPASASPLHCTSQSVLADATVIAAPFEGLLLGWRNQFPKRFPPPAAPRGQCFAIDAIMVATGDLDATIILFGGVWDFAATSLIVRESGGVFRDVWGGERFDTATGVFTNPNLIDQVLATLQTERPSEPDAPVLAKMVSTPIGGDGDNDQEDGWKRFGITHMPSMSARTHVDHAPPFILDIVDERAAHLAEPLVGVTTDGVAQSGLRSLDGPRVTTQPILDAVLAFLQALEPAQRERASFAMDAIEWRMWINVHMNHFRHGVMLEDLPPQGRELALDILRATLSARGFHHARSIMRLNELIAELTGDWDAFGEWPYFMSIFGTPGTDEPWGWQIDGHHLCVNTVVFDGRIVMTPTFMGAEPRRVHHGPYAGISLFDPEEALGLDLIRSFDAAQRSRAVIYPSIHPDHISPILQNRFDGRMQAGAFHDNLIAPYQGVSGSDMTDAQRRVLLELAATYVGWEADAHALVRMPEVNAHLDETWFSWYGGTDDESPFYYRVHSPVIMIEFDHHPGVAFDNIVPSRHHVHTVMRTPSGGDYGADLLQQHHEQFDHTHGHHQSRH